MSLGACARNDDGDTRAKRIKRSLTWLAPDNCAAAEDSRASPTEKGRLLAKESDIFVYAYLWSGKMIA